MVENGTVPSVGIVRVSEVGDRSGESFISPVEQRRQFGVWAIRERAHMVEVFEELNVKGGKPLHKRPGLRRAVAMVESGEVKRIVFAYFDRSFRDVVLQMETLYRIEKAGGELWAIDFGRISALTAAQWAAQAYMGVGNELQRRSTGEKVRNAHRDAVARGVPPFTQLIRGYRRGPDGRILVEPDEAPHVTKAFKMRANGSTLRQCQTFLAEHGIQLSYNGVASMFESKLPLGELHAGQNVNLHSHEALVDRMTWDRVQQRKEPRGRPPSTPRLLTQHGGLLRCSGCMRAMSSSSRVFNGKRFRVFICSRKYDCPRPVSVGANVLERCVIAEWKKHWGERSQSATPDTEVQAAEDLVEQRTVQLTGITATLDGLDVPGGRQRIMEAKAELDEAIDHLNRLLVAAGPAEIVLAGRDFESFDLDDQRALIRAAWRTIVVAPAARRGNASVEMIRARLTFEKREPVG
jgi:DNA invertase Pin-like site-specific DNA recombinase